MSTSIAKYGRYEPEAQAEDEKLTEKLGKFYKLKNGDSVVRVLPPKLGRTRPWAVSYQHFVQLDPVNPSSILRYNCPKKASKGFAWCPLCERGEALRSTGKVDDRERGYELLPKFRAYAAIIDRADEKAGVQIFAFGTKLFDKLRAIMRDGDFTDPTEEGYDLVLTKAGSGKNGTTYDARAKRGNSALHAQVSQLNEWIENIPDLERLAEAPNEQQMQALWANAQRGRGNTENASNNQRMTGGGSIDTQGETVGDNAEDLFSGQGDDSDDIPF